MHGKKIAHSESLYSIPVGRGRATMIDDEGVLTDPADGYGLLLSKCTCALDDFTSGTKRLKEGGHDV